MHLPAINQLFFVDNCAIPCGTTDNRDTKMNYHEHVLPITRSIWWKSRNVLNISAQYLFHCKAVCWNHDKSIPNEQKTFARQHFHIYLHHRIFSKRIYLSKPKCGMGGKRNHSGSLTCSMVGHSKARISSHSCTVEWPPKMLLTHWGGDKMAAIFQTTFSNGFSWMKMYDFRLTFHWSLFLGVQLTILQHWFR